MVYTDLVSQDVDVIKRLIDYHQLPVLAVHAPSLLLTQRVWGREPWEKIRRSQVMAEQLGAKHTVVGDGKQVDAVKELTGGQGAHVVLDFVAEQGAEMDGWNMTRPAG